MSVRILAVAMAMLSISGCEIAEVFTGPPPSTKPELSPSERAIQNAQESLDYFFLCLRKADGVQFLAKAVMADSKGQREAIWLSAVRKINSEELSGKVYQRPELLTNLKTNKAIKFARSQIQDWIVVKDGAIMGGFTESFDVRFPKVRKTTIEAEEVPKVRSKSRR